MPAKKANRSPIHTANGKSMAAEVNARPRSDSSGLGHNTMVMAAARGAQTIFSLVSNAKKSNTRQRKSWRARAARKAPATKTVASGFIANARLIHHDSQTGGDTTTNTAAIKDGPVPSPSAICAILKASAPIPATAKQLMSKYNA